MLNKKFGNLKDRVRLLFRKDKESYLCFYRMLGFYPHNLKIYEQALLHKSSSVKTEKGRPLNNERLEFLGDAILDAVVGDIVYQKFDGKREGFLTNTRSKIVSRESLNRLAEQIGLLKLIKFNARQSAHNSYMGGHATEMIANGQFGRMVTLQGSKIGSIPLEDVAGRLKLVSENHDLILQGKRMGICFG